MIINKSLKCLITACHVISKNMINSIIDIEIYNKKIIKLDLNNRNIKFMTDLDIAIIEIKDNDEIIKDGIKFLLYDLNFKLGYEQYLNKDIFCLQYTKNKEDIEYAAGKVIEIINNEKDFKHNIDTDYGSSGAPIILHNTEKVIGIHLKADLIKKFNYGTFIGQIFKDISLNKKNNNSNDKINNNNKSNNNKDNKSNIINKQINKNLKDNNYIIGEIHISKENVGKDIRIINSYEEDLREYIKNFGENGIEIIEYLKMKMKLKNVL